MKLFFHHLLSFHPKYLLLAGMVFFSTFSFGQIDWQSPSFKLSTDDGLPDNYIKSIVEDPYGFIWIASNKGLSRFDGAQVEQIMSENLPEAYYSKIYLDAKRDQLWIGSYFGLYTINLKTLAVKQIEAADPKHKINVYINSLFIDRNERLWISTRKGLNSVDLETGEIQKYMIEIDTTRFNYGLYNKITDIIQDPKEDDKLWVATTGGMFSFDLHNKEQKLIAPNLDKLRKAQSISYLYQDSHSDYIYASVRTATGGQNPYQYLVLDPEKESFVKGISTTSAWKSANIFPHSSGKIWLSSNEGIAIYNTLKGELENLSLHQANASNNNRIEYIDSNHRLWTSTQKGLEVFDPIKSQCQNNYYTSAFPKAYHIISEINKSSDGKDLYLAVYGSDGLYKFDRLTRSWEIYPVQGKKGQVFDATSVQVDAEGRVIVISNSHIYVLDKAKKELLPMSLPFPLQAAGRGLKSIYDPVRKALWILFRKGLYRWNFRNNTYKAYPGFPDFCSESQSASSLYLDKKGRIWFTGLCTGFLVFDPKTDKKWTQEDFPELKNTLHTSEVSSVIEWKDTLYLLSENLELAKVPMEDLGKRKVLFQDLTSLIPSDKYPNLANIHDIGYAAGTSGAFDKEGNYFILTAFGLLRYSQGSQRIEIFDKAEGFIFEDRELQVYVAEKLILLPDGKMAYGTRKGIHIFDPAKLKKDQRLPRPYIRNIDINDHPYQPDSAFYFKKNYTLEAGQYYISFDFSAIDQSSSGDRKYRHMLEGVDPDWISLRDRSSISYPNLKGGDYTFNLMVSNEKGIWNPEIARAHISIKKFWYNTYLARAFGITFLICIAILWYHFRVKRAIEKEQMRTNFEKKLAEVKMNALTAQMNPHFIFNSLNSIDYFIIKNESQMASEYLNRFSRLIRLILNNSRSNYISLKEDLDALKLYIEIESLRFDKKFEYEVTTCKNLDTELIQIPPMLFQPYVENAIWHGLMQKNGRGIITVDVKLDERKEVIIGTITDNGIGRKKAKEIKSKGAKRKKNKSMGMQITQDKIDAINFLHDLKASVTIHDLLDEEGNASGTQVILEIPI